jgi:flagellar biogenesis protein FliO
MSGCPAGNYCRILRGPELAIVGTTEKKLMDKIKKILLLAVLCALCTSAPADEDTSDMVLSPRAAAAPATPAEIKPAPNQMASSLRVTGVWLVILGIGAGGLTYMAKKRNAKGSGPGNQKRLEVMERISLGGQRELLLVKVCDRLLVVAAQSNQMTLLSDLPTDVSPSLPFSAFTDHDIAVPNVDRSATSGLVVAPTPLQNRIAKEYGADLQGSATASASTTQPKAVKPWPDLTTGSLS